MAQTGMVLRGSGKGKGKGSSGLAKRGGSGVKRRSRGAGALGMGGGAGGMAKRLGMVAGSALVVKYVSDALVEKLFEDEADPKMQAVYRGGVQIVGGAALGYWMWKKGYREFGLGVAIGGTVGGGMRIAEAYDWDQTIHDWFQSSDDTAATPAPATGGATGLYLGQSRGRTWNGNAVRTGQRVAGTAGT